MDMVTYILLHDQGKQHNPSINKLVDPSKLIILYCAAQYSIYHLT